MPVYWLKITYMHVALANGKGHSETLVGILRCMVVKACPQRRKALYGGAFGWFRGSARMS